MIAPDLYPLHVICLPCFRQCVTPDGQVPRTAPAPEEKCELCGERTSDGIRVINRTFQRLIEKWPAGEQNVRP